MLRSLVLLLVFSLGAAEAAPRVRAVSQAPGPVAISGEFTTADPIFDAAHGAELDPHVATGGGIGLVVWNHGQKAARLGADGRLLDPTPIEVLPAQAPAASEVVFHAGAFTFAAVVRPGDSHELLLARVTPAGEVSTRRIAPTLAAHSASLAVNGRGELLIVVATQQTIETYFVSADGTTTLGPRLAGARPKIASDATDFLMLHQNSGASFVTRIGRDRAAAAPAPITLPQTHDLLWNGTDYVVLGFVTDVLRGVRVSAAGVVGEAFLAVPTSTSMLSPSFSWTGSEYRVLWKQREAAPSGSEVRYETWTARVAANGHVIESVRVGNRADVAGGHFGIGAADIAGSLMAWSEAAVLAPGVFAWNIFATAGPGQPIELVSRRANDQYQTVVAQNGAATLVVSADWRRTLDDLGFARLSFTRIAGDGSRTPGPGALLYPTRGSQDFPDAAWNGTDTWIVWRETGGIFAARIDANGTLLDREPIEVARGSAFMPSIACGAADCLVVWMEPEPIGSRVRSVRFAPNGTRLDAEAAHHGRGVVEGVVRAGGGYAFAMIGDLGALSLVRVGAGTTLIPRGTDGSVAVAWNGSEYLVVWRLGGILSYTRFDAAGNQLDAPQSLGRGQFPTAIWTGRHFLVVWHPFEPNLAGARITRGGAIVDAFPITEHPEHESDPLLRMRDDGTFVLSYTRTSARGPYWTAFRNVVRFGRD